MILSLTGRFHPCINPEWNKVYNISSLPIDVPDRIVELDNKFRKHVIMRDKHLDQREEEELLTWYRNNLTVAKQSSRIRPEEVKDAAKSVSDIYRFQL